ncbi:hypothetical protein [Paenibacillus sp. P36]|uniref:hypothetical protein n=1 Tax=Paenibacillus sp. P36 TaxID=3342538 RepID=UPI0038B37E57
MNLYDIKIAIVDDEPSIVTMLQMVLRREGFQHLYAASTCAEALDVAARIAPDIETKKAAAMRLFVCKFCKSYMNSIGLWRTCE